MATKKAASSTKNGRDSNPRYLGIKLYSGETAKIGSILVRQEGRNVLAGRNVGVGKDHTLFALKAGKVAYGEKRKGNFDGSSTKRKIVHVE
jgi:large subunit ribosomal protein L27